jgi:hypoxanthine phosphoribosyltransferase
MALRYLSADQLLADAQQLAVKIVHSGFQPDLLVALWRGGAPVGVAIHEVLALAGTACEHLPLRAESYTGINQQQAVRFHGFEQLTPLLQSSARVLLVDDVFDTGSTMGALCSHIHACMPARPLLLKIATPWYKPGKNLTALVPDFHLHTTDDWLVFPHELQHLTDAQLLDKPGNSTLLQQLVELRKQRPQTSQPPR